ncbi:hypothetical protein GCM10023075_07960 [Streptosporangium album]
MDRDDLEVLLGRDGHRLAEVAVVERGLVRAERESRVDAGAPDARDGLAGQVGEGLADARLLQALGRLGGELLEGQDVGPEP